MRKKPMLAYPVSTKPIDYNEPVFIQPKLDGVRCIIQQEFHKDGDKVVAYSRTGKEWKNIDHILEELKLFFHSYPNVILDGELYNHDLKNDFEKIISLVRKTKPTAEDRVESSEMVQFHCYDIIDEKLPFDQRIEFVTESLMLLGDSIHTVDTTQCFTESDAKVFHADNLELGYEGSIVRTNDTYHCNRSHNLRKFKDFHDAEALLCEWVEGKGKRVGTIGKFMAIDENGVVFGMPVMDKFKYLQENLKR